jgi:hypothetical protein
MLKNILASWEMKRKYDVSPMVDLGVVIGIIFAGYIMHFMFGIALFWIGVVVGVVYGVYCLYLDNHIGHVILTEGEDKVWEELGLW